MAVKNFGAKAVTRLSPNRPEQNASVLMHQKRQNDIERGANSKSVVKSTVFSTSTKKLAVAGMQTSFDELDLMDPIPLTANVELGSNNINFLINEDVLHLHKSHGGTP